MSLSHVIPSKPPLPRGQRDNSALPPTRDDKPGKHLDASAPEPALTGIWVALATIAMMFAAFTSAAVVRQGASNDWEHIALPALLYINTGILILSGIALELARRTYLNGVKHGMPSAKIAVRWLTFSLLSGVAFLVGQIVVWWQLLARSVDFISSPTNSFFYVLTVFHAVHVAGGIGGLVRIWVKMRRFDLKRSTLNATCWYWHFMSVLWIYIFVLLIWKF